MYNSPTKSQAYSGFTISEINTTVLHVYMYKFIACSVMLSYYINRANQGYHIITLKWILVKI